MKINYENIYDNFLAMAYFIYFKHLPSSNIFFSNFCSEFVTFVFI